MINYKEVFEKANKEYQEYQKRANFNDTRVDTLGKQYEFLTKAIIEEVNKVLIQQKKPNPFLDFTKGEDK